MRNRRFNPEAGFYPDGSRAPIINDDPLSAFSDEEAEQMRREIARREAGNRLYAVAPDLF